MGSECNYSFFDLYEAAFGRKISLKEKMAFQQLSQEEINDLVLVWAEEAGWKTTKKRGSDNKIYRSFHP